MPKKLTYKFIKEQFEKDGYELLSKKYISARSKLKYRCPKEHECSIRWDDWRKDHRCPYCAGNGKLTIEFIRSEFMKENYKLLADKYINTHSKLEYICPNGHKHSISWSHFRNGHRCLYCTGQDKPTIEFIRSEFEKEGYKLLSTEYVDNKRKLKYICSKGHIHSIAWSSWNRGKRCPYCIGIISKGEIEVRNFIESLGVKISANDRNQIFNPFTNYPLELDIFMPNLNKAIEYNGEYWHQDKTRDLLKQQLCELKEIDLLTIWDKEWSNNSRECKEKIMKFMF